MLTLVAIPQVRQGVSFDLEPPDEWTRPAG